MKTILQSFTYALAIGLIACGCSRSDLHTVVKDAKGVEKGSPVSWREQTVGKVSKTSATGEGIRLDVSLDKPYRKQIRVGVEACPLALGDTLNVPALYLVGGTDASAPKLPKGSLVPVISPETKILKNFWNWLFRSEQSRQQLYMGLLLIPVPFILGWIFKRVFKMVFTLAMVALVIFVLHGLKKGWDVETFVSESSAEIVTFVEKHKHHIGESAKWVNDILHKAVKQP